MLGARAHSTLAHTVTGAPWAQMVTALNEGNMRIAQGFLTILNTGLQVPPPPPYSTPASRWGVASAR